MKTIKLLVNETELDHLKWALSMDVELSDDQLKEKRTLLARLKRMEGHDSDEPIEQQSLALLELSARTTNALHHAKIETVGDLLKKKPFELLREPNFGRRSLDEVKVRLSDFGLTLAARENGQ